MRKCGSSLAYRIENELLRWEIQLLKNQASTKHPDLSNFLSTKYCEFHFTLDSDIKQVIPFNSAADTNLELQNILGKRILSTLSKVQPNIECKYWLNDIKTEFGDFVSVTYYKGLALLTEVFELETEEPGSDENRLQKALNQLFLESRQGIIVIDETDKIHFVNSAAKEMFQSLTPCKAQKGSVVTRCIPDNSKREFIHLLLEAKAGNTVQSVLTFYTNEGRQLWNEVVCLPYNFKSEKAVIIGLRNVSDHVITHTRLEQYRLQAKESDRLKRAFLTNMSHEIRTPMNGIIGFAGLLNNPNLSDDKKKAYSEIISENSKSLLHIFEEMLDVARIEAGEMIKNNVVFDINKLFDDVFYYGKNNLASKLNGHTSLDYNKFSSDPLYILADKGKIKQILINLLNNSIKFTNKGKVHFSYTIDQQFLKLVVEDAGIGIKNSELDLIFESFMHSAPNNSTKYDGPGLGLSIVKGFTDFMGGIISYNSRENEGTTFEIHIPVKVVNDNLPNQKLLSSKKVK
jgi:PAS domain S-box-containing protein